MIICECLNTNNIVRLTWLSQSPDLNPIENLSDEFDKRVRLKRYKNKAQLFEKMLKIWNDIPEDVIEKVIHSMPRRYEEVNAIKDIGAISNQLIQYLNQ